jgi:hypothetical protein
MKRLNPQKLHVAYSNGAAPEDLVLPRRYTLTHSDRTGELFLTISNAYNKKQTSSLYTKLMRDEVLAEFSIEEDGLVFRVYCHVSGGFVFGTAKLRYAVFCHELPLVLEAIRFGDRNLFEKNPNLDNTPVLIHFQSTANRFNKVENWGTMADYR